MSSGDWTNMDMHAALETEFDVMAAAAPSSAGRWVETALTALCTASAVLFVSFIAVVTGLVCSPALLFYRFLRRRNPDTLRPWRFTWSSATRIIRRGRSG